MKPDVRQLILKNHVDDLNWLRDSVGVLFDDIDYSDIPEIKDDVFGERDYEWFSEIVDVDESVCERLKFLCMKELAETLTAKK